MMSFGGEPKEKKENNYECTEIYHLLPTLLKINFELAFHFV